MTSNGIAAKLDWNKMLGFEQISDVREQMGKGAARVGAKVGDKVGQKVGTKVGAKVGNKIGVKEGIKA